MDGAAGSVEGSQLRGPFDQMGVCDHLVWVIPALMVSAGKSGPGARPACDFSIVQLATEVNRLLVAAVVHALRNWKYRCLPMYERMTWTGWYRFGTIFYFELSPRALPASFPEASSFREAVDKPPRVSEAKDTLL